MGYQAWQIGQPALASYPTCHVNGRLKNKEFIWTGRWVTSLGRSPNLHVNRPLRDVRGWRQLFKGGGGGDHLLDIHPLHVLTLFQPRLLTHVRLGHY